MRKTEIHQKEKKGFEIYEGKGFHLTFENGWTVSVQFGAGNYCDHRDALRGSFDPNFRLAQGPSDTAEIAAFHKDGTWHEFKHDQVKGWCSADEVAQFIYKVSKKKDRGAP